MAIDKPTAPQELLPDEFGGVKENFSDSLINTGYEDGVREILGGANLNYFIDTLGKNFKYHRIISDYINNIPVSKSLIVNTNNKLDYTQYGLRVYNPEENYGLGEWVVGQVDLGGRKIYESLIVNNIGNALNSQYWQEVNLGKITSICFRSVGETVFSLTPLNDDTLKLLNGQLIEAENVPDDFNEYITWLRTNAPQCFTTETNWQTINSTYGECGKFVYNEENGNIRLPKVNGIVQGTNTVSVLGDIIQAGLPSISHTHTRGNMNITGTFSGVGQYYYNSSHNMGATLTGAFYRANTANQPTEGVYIENNFGSSARDDYFGFNAASSWTGSTSTNSNVSSIYGNSNTVQPQTVQGFYYIVFTNNNAQQQVEEIIGDKASKSYVQEQIDDLSEDIANTYATKTDVSKVYKPSGTVTFENLPILSASVVGNVYNVTDGFTTTSDFLEGAGKIVSAGTDVAIVDIGTSESPIYKYNLLSTNVDMSNYYTKQQVYNKPEIDTKLLEIQTGDVDVSQQISSVVDDKFIEGTGIDFTSGLKTTTTVTSSNPNLTVTSSYSGTRPSTGRESYEFTYNGSDWEYNETVVDLTIYYLTVDGTPVENDKITLIYNTITTTTISAEFDGSYAELTGKPSFASVATSGSYNDLTNKPAIATYYAGSGISITPKLQTAVSVECSNPNLTVTSSYDDTESTTGVISYEFEYINGKLDKYPIATTHAERCNFFILNGNLYYFPKASGGDTWTLVDNSGTWTMVTGMAYVSGSSIYYAYGINDGKLYRLDTTPAITQVGSSSSWTYVAGYSYSSSAYAYGINDGKLYHLSNTTTTQVGSDTTWTMVTSNGNQVYGLNNKKLYLISGTSAQKIGDLDWDMVSDGRAGYNVICFGISDGKLYSIDSTTVAQVGSDTGWTYVCGCAYSTTMRAYGIRNGTLYSIDSSSSVSSVKNNITKVILNGNNKFCCLDTSGIIYRGSANGASATATFDSYSWDNIYYCDTAILAIREGALYFVDPNYATITLIGQIETSNGWNLNGSFVELNDYYLTATGTPELNDTIDLTYTTTTAPNAYTISATEGV